MSDTPNSDGLSNGQEKVLNLITALMGQMQEKTDEEARFHLTGQVVALQMALGLMIGAMEAGAPFSWERVARESAHYLQHLETRSVAFLPELGDGFRVGLDTIRNFADLWKLAPPPALRET